MEITKCEVMINYIIISKYQYIQKLFIQQIQISLYNQWIIFYMVMDLHILLLIQHNLKLVNHIH